jgi:hypothetical protein
LQKQHKFLSIPLLQQQHQALQQQQHEVLCKKHKFPGILLLQQQHLPQQQQQHEALCKNSTSFLASRSFSNSTRLCYNNSMKRSAAPAPAPQRPAPPATAPGSATTTT